MVGVDGSDASEFAYQLVSRDIVKSYSKHDSTEDYLIVGSVINRAKDKFLPYNMKSHYLIDRYTASMVQHGKHGRFYHVDIEEGKTTKQTMWEMGKAEQADILVVGNHGRKGPKSDETVCGTAIEHIAANQTFPVIIIKDFKPRSTKKDGLLRYGICYDGSSKSKKAFELVCNIMRPQDKLAVIWVNEPTSRESSDTVKSYVHRTTEKFGLEKVEVHMLDPIPGKSTYQTIKHFLQYQASNVQHGYIDFVAVGNAGMRFDSLDAKDHLGSVANSVLRARRMNVIFVP